MMTGVVDEMVRRIERIREVRLECRGPTLGHAFRRSELGRAAGAHVLAQEQEQVQDDDRNASQKTAAIFKWHDR